jgi:hypothetical protein
MQESVVYILIVVGFIEVTMILGYVRILDQSLRKLRQSLFENKVVNEPPSPERSTQETLTSGIQAAVARAPFTGTILTAITRKASV